MPTEKIRRHVPQEISLTHDAATWDEDTFGSAWDDEEGRLILELARSDDDGPGYAI